MTRETLHEQQKESSAEGASTNDDDDPFGQEMALFMSEINESESQPATFDQNEHQNNENVHKFKVCTCSMLLVVFTQNVQKDPGYFFKLLLKAADNELRSH